MARYDNRRVFKKDLYTRNGNIRAQEVRVIDSDGSMIGIQPLSVAIAMAKEQELDLVEISPNAQPPVCKILDYNKYVFEQSKKNKDAKKKQSKVTMKELRIKSRIAPHDLDVKLRQIEGFLKKKDMVRLVVVFHGRENQHKDIGMQMLQDAAKRLEPLANVDGGLQQQLFLQDASVEGVLFNHSGRAHVMFAGSRNRRKQMFSAGFAVGIFTLCGHAKAFFRAAVVFHFRHLFSSSLISRRQARPPLRKPVRGQVFS